MADPGPAALSVVTEKRLPQELWPPVQPGRDSSSGRSCLLLLLLPDLGPLLWAAAVAALSLTELAARAPCCEPHRPAHLIPSARPDGHLAAVQGLRRLGQAASAVRWQAPSGWAAAGAMWRRLAFSLRCQARASSSRLPRPGTRASLSLGREGNGAPPGTELSCCSFSSSHCWERRCLRCSKVGWLHTAAQHIRDLTAAPELHGCRPDLVCAHEVTSGSEGPAAMGAAISFPLGPSSHTHQGPLLACSQFLETKATLMPWEVCLKPWPLPLRSPRPPQGHCGTTACKAGVCRTLANATCIFNSAAACVNHRAFTAQLSLLAVQPGGTGSAL